MWFAIYGNIKILATTKQYYRVRYCSSWGFDGSIIRKKMKIVRLRRIYSG